MTPEQLRMITDAMASAGAAIGGPGSAGDLIGQTVIQHNRREHAAALTEKAREEEAARQAARGAQYAAAMGGPGVGQSGLGSMGMQGMQPAFTQQGKQGATSIKAGTKPGEYTMTFNTEDDPGIGPGAGQGESPVKANSVQPSAPVNAGNVTQAASPSNSATNLLTREDWASIIAKQQQQVMNKSTLESQALTRKKTEQDIASGKLIQLPGGGAASVGDVGRFLLGENATPAKIKTLEALMASTKGTKNEKKTLFDTDVALRESGRTNISIGNAADKAGAVAAAKVTATGKARFGSSDWMSDLDTEYSKTGPGLEYDTYIASGTPEDVVRVKEAKNAWFNAKIKAGAGDEFKGNEVEKFDKQGNKWVGEMVFDEKSGKMVFKPYARYRK